jgi:hypothetical protein
LNCISAIQHPHEHTFCTHVHPKPRISSESLNHMETIIRSTTSHNQPALILNSSAVCCRMPPALIHSSEQCCYMGFAGRAVPLGQIFAS